MGIKVDLNLTYTKAQVKMFLTPYTQKYLVISKGRRLGATQGFAQSSIEDLLDGKGPILWVDTIYANIDRYFDRYFRPVLNQLPDSMWSWNAQRKELKLGGSWMDFRSADKPENIEGFGYRKIFLNEAGIILKNPDLFTKTILPMLLDYPDSQLIAAGVPKGMYLKTGEEHKFYELRKRCDEDPKKYKFMQFSSHDNPFLNNDDIEALAMELSGEEYQQEVMGEFVESSGNRPFCTQYDKLFHEAPVKQHKGKQLIISLDINLDPMALCFSNFWKEGPKIFDHQFDEISVENASVFRAAELIRKKYGQYLSNCIIIGDAMGKKREVSQRDHASFYIQLKRELGLRDSQFKIPKANPTHENSRADVNWVLWNGTKGKNISYLVNPETCPNTCRDYKNVQVDAYGSILKKSRTDINQRADFLDANRYKIHILWSQMVKRSRRTGPSRPDPKRPDFRKIL